MIAEITVKAFGGPICEMLIFVKIKNKVYIEFSLLQQWLSEQATNPSLLSKALKSDTFGKE